jgi:hypothetical protein
VIGGLVSEEGEGAKGECIYISKSPNMEIQRLHFVFLRVHGRYSECFSF